MADFVITTGIVALTAASTKSLILLNPVTNPTTIFGLDVSFDSNVATLGIKIDLYIVTTIGTPAGTAAVVNKMSADSGATATTAGLTALTAEPTAVTVLCSWYEQPFGGWYPTQLPLGREFKMAAAGARWGVRYTTATSVAPNCILNCYIEE